MGGDIRRALAGIALAVTCVAAAGCGGGAGGGGQPVKVGLTLPLTGERAGPGRASQHGYLIWEELVNKHGGLLGRPVRLLLRDDASDARRVTAGYTRLIVQDRADLLLGTFSSLLNLPASAVAEQHRMVIVCPSCGSPKLFDRGFHYMFFAQPAVAAHQADLFAQWVASLSPGERPRTVAYPTLDDPFTQPVIESLRRQLDAIGIRAVYAKVYPEGTASFDAIARAIKASGADLVAQGAQFEDGVGLVRSLVRTGYQPRILFQTTAPSEGDQYARAVGSGNANGVFYAVSWSPDASYPRNQEFVQAYRARYGTVPEEDAADAFAAAQVLEAAVAAVGSLDQAKLAGWLHANTVQTILGPLSWDEHGAPEQTFILAQWQDGQSKIVLPRNVASTDKILVPKPAWQRG
jgi:branched-chain amino acid transport system substrate-binding protein